MTSADLGQELATKWLMCGAPAIRDRLGQWREMVTTAEATGDLETASLARHCVEVLDARLEQIGREEGRGERRG